MNRPTDPRPVRPHRTRPERPYIDPYLAGGLLGVVLFAAFFLTSNGLGASGGLNHLTAWLENLVAPEHVGRTGYVMEIAGGDRSPLAHWTVYMVVGTLIGGLLSGWLNGRLKVETNRGPRITPRTRWMLALVGGLLMGYGARFARGCTSGQALSGGATLSVGSWAFMLAVFAGAYALAPALRRAWR